MPRPLSKQINQLDDTRDVYRMVAHALHGVGYSYSIQDLRRLVATSVDLAWFADWAQHARKDTISYPG